MSYELRVPSYEENNSYLYKKKSLSMANVIGTSIRYKSDKGEISLLEPCLATKYNYELQCIAGNFFDDIEYYPTLQDAEKRITDLLGPADKHL